MANLKKYSDCPNTANHNIGALQDNVVKDKKLTQKVLLVNNEAFRMGREKPKSVQELQDRFDDYFGLCYENGLPPTVEGLALVSGYVRGSFWDIEQGKFKQEFTDTVKRAKDYIQNYDAYMANMNKLNAAIYCFRAKNFYDMKDVQEIKAVPVQDPTIPTNETEIMEALPECPTTLEDSASN